MKSGHFCCIIFIFCLFFVEHILCLCYFLFCFWWYGPDYLSKLLNTYTPSYQLCSASWTRFFTIPPTPVIRNKPRQTTRHSAHGFSGLKTSVQSLKWKLGGVCVFSNNVVCVIFIKLLLAVMDIDHAIQLCVIDVECLFISLIYCYGWMKSNVSVDWP